jgi:hypothetical protein
MNKPILFKAPGCGACVKQDELLHKNFSGTVYQINVDKFPGQFQFIQFTPTWAIPLGNDKYRLHSEIVETPEELQRLSSFGKTKKRKYKVNRRTHFGETPVNSLAVYGKNFPDNQGFKTTDSFYKSVENVWGKGNDTLNAGFGPTRALSPDKVNDVFSTNNFNNIRMARPNDDLGAVIGLNRSCNTMKNPPTMASSPGLVTGSGNPQIVDNTTGTQFGRRKRRSRFGDKGLYSQMGPASEIGNQYLMGKNTVQGLYGGATQFEGPRPHGIQSNTFLGQAKLYSSGSGKTVAFGKKRKTGLKTPKRLTPKKKGKTLNVSGKKAVNIKINIKQKNSN